jgi:hypothetical protein
VRLALYHLRGQVVQGATERRPAVKKVTPIIISMRKRVHLDEHERQPISRRVNAPTKISYLELAVHSDQQVLGFDVAMNDVLAVKITERIRHL